MKQIAEHHSFKFLSDKYLGVLEKHDWMCPNGHIWSARPNNVMNGSGCPECSHRQLRKTVDDIRKIAKDRGFFLISRKFLGMKNKHLWKCKDGHKWMATPQNIKMTGCPKCSGGIREEQVRFIFESLLGHHFPKNRTVLKGLELDGYCEELEIAFEYNGEQHYKNHYLNQNNVHKIREHDRKKTILCSNLGITKIDIPYTKNDCLEEFISSNMKKLGFDFSGHVDWSKFIGKPAKLNNLKRIASIRKGELISDQYLGSHEKHKWKCSKCSLRWEATAKDVLSGSWCPRCAKNQKYTPDKMRQFALDRGFVFIPHVYLGMNIPHLFACKYCNHEWMVKPNRIQQGAKCPSCKGKGGHRNAY